MLKLTLVITHLTIKSQAKSEYWI